MAERILVVDDDEESTPSLAMVLRQRIEGGRLVIDPREVDLLGLVRDAATLAQLRTVAHHIRVEGESVIATVDPMRIEQVLSNLLDNAIKYSPGGGVIQVEVLATAPDQLMIRVTDSGLGVPIEHRPHIFDRFYQAHAKSYLSGLGLGLYISRQIVELHGGVIHAFFPSTGGTKIEVTLPTRPRRGFSSPATVAT